MKKLTLVFMPILCLLVSCSPKVTSTITKAYPSLSSDTPVKVFYREDIPVESEEIGQVRIYDSGMSTGCDSLTVINMIKNQARKAGGNAVLITEHKKPSVFGSSELVIARVYPRQSKDIDCLATLRCARNDE